MPRLVVYVRSRFCPDVGRWRRWRDRHEVDAEELDIDLDPEARARLLALTGHESVPTLVIAGDELVPRDARLDGVEVVEIRPVMSGGSGGDQGRRTG